MSSLLTRISISFLCTVLRHIKKLMAPISSQIWGSISKNPYPWNDSYLRFLFPNNKEGIFFCVKTNCSNSLKEALESKILDGMGKNDLCICMAIVSDSSQKIKKRQPVAIYLNEKAIKISKNLEQEIRAQLKIYLKNFLLKNQQSPSNKTRFHLFISSQEWKWSLNLLISGQNYSQTV